MSKNHKYKLNVEIRSGSTFEIKKSIDELRRRIALGKDIFTSERLSYSIELISEENTDLMPSRIEIINGKKCIVIPSKMNELC